jgi:2-polyprenyl-3-methyl-5-hydroxy-6-metoxy-1,4-benzoquinol methylase
MVVSFESADKFPGWGGAPDLFKSLFAEHASKCILEIGSGANPTLASEFVRDNGLLYVTSDVNFQELEKADSAFQKLVLDLSVKTIDTALNEKFDCVLSRMVGEHISNGHQYHKNIYKMLRPGGISAHCFSTLWTFPFAVNRLLPESISDRLLQAFAPRNRHQQGKFKAYYSWSRGPSKGMIRRFEDLGFEVIRYTGYFGHSYYRSLPLLDRTEALKTRLLLKLPVPQLCSYSTLVLRKPKVDPRHGVPE